MSILQAILQAERTAPRSLPETISPYQRREMGIAPYRPAREQCASTLRVLLAFVAVIALLSYGLDWVMASQDFSEMIAVGRFGLVGLAALVLVGVGFGLAIERKGR